MAIVRDWIQVLFLYQHIDDFVMKNLAQYAKRKIISIETAEGCDFNFDVSLIVSCLQSCVVAAAAEHKDSTTDKSKDLEPVDADMSGT